MFGSTPPDVASVINPPIDTVIRLTVTCEVALAPWYVAVMSASPGLTPVTRPAPVTLATAALDEVHDAWLVTVCDVPFEKFAMALNDAVNPTLGALPLTVTDKTDSAGAGVRPGVGVEGVAGVPLLLLHAAVARVRIHVKSRTRRMAIPSASRVAEVERHPAETSRTPYTAARAERVGFITVWTS